ncbi:hypothetical protein F4810DRAFT_12305 [Camillea tinctor]|nr:hypothetical protein F4810DRAFT_12305 [Camillea tinctor]
MAVGVISTQARCALPRLYYHVFPGHKTLSVYAFLFFSHPGVERPILYTVTSPSPFFSFFIVVFFLGLFILPVFLGRPYPLDPLTEAYICEFFSPFVRFRMILNKKEKGLFQPKKKK